MRARARLVSVCAMVLGAGLLGGGCSAVATTSTPGAPLGSASASATAPSAASATAPSAAPTAVPSAGPSGPVASAARRIVRAPTSPCAGNRQRRWVLVSISRQHLWMCDRAVVVRATPITSGMVGRYTGTPVGRYRIQGLNRDTSLALNTGAVYPVKYWIPLDAPLFGFHDSSWQHFAYGSAKYRTDGSHGCVHVPLTAIRFLYRWARIGTPVTIRR